MDQNVLLGHYQLTIFHNENNGYRIAKFRLSENNNLITVIGIMPSLSNEYLYELSGNYINHPKYGLQFQLTSYQMKIPNKKDELVCYFSSSIFPGIGKKSAKLLVDTLGVDLIKIIKDNSKVLDNLPKPLKNKKYIILNGIQEENSNLLQSFFVKYGISISNAKRIEKHYGEDAISIIKQNPYRLVYEIDGIGIVSADKIAKSIDFPMDSLERYEAVFVTSLLNLSMKYGDTYVEVNDLKNYFKKKDLFNFNFEACMEQLVLKKLIVIEGDKVFHFSQYQAEKEIASFLSQFPFVQRKSSYHNLDKEINKIENKLYLNYDLRQKEAIQAFFKESFMILTGGPGTGKTTIVKGILELYKKIHPNRKVLLCAPTGRAAKRLSELSDQEASTIHRLLKWNIEDNTFEVNEQNPIVADVLFIDEFSMVDNWLFSHLLSACKNISKIILIGDENQLESVGCGSLLKDLIASDCFPIIRMEHIYRQHEGSEVVELSHAMLRGDTSCLRNGNDIAFFPCESNEAKDQILKIVSHALEKGYKLSDLQVIAPMYQGIAGIDVLNQSLQEICNPPSSEKRELNLENRTFREGDRILQLKNQVDDNVYNGDIGVIIDINFNYENALRQNIIVAQFDDIIVEYTPDQFQNITHAYCISIHKSQGSEYPIVILPILFDYRYLLSSRLIYTAITRARKSIVLVGNKDAFYYSINYCDSRIRKSTLCERLKNKFSLLEPLTEIYEKQLTIIE